MPVSLKYVHELPWKVTSHYSIEINGSRYERHGISHWPLQCVRLINGTQVLFSDECREQLLDAMDNFGKAEEPERWKSTAVWAKGSGGYAVEIHSKCLLELRAGLEKLEAKLEELSKK